MAGRLQGKFVVVTGAGQGLGEAIAVRLAREGAAGIAMLERLVARELEGWLPPS